MMMLLQLIIMTMMMMMMMMMIMGREHPFMGVVVVRRSWHLKLFFSFNQDPGFGGQSVSMGYLLNEKIKFQKL